MKKVIITVEVEVDETAVARKYPNFTVNYETNRRGVPTKRGLRQFARRCVMTEAGMRGFGFNVKITGIEVAPAGILNR